MIRTVNYYNVNFLQDDVVQAFNNAKNNISNI
jgi:hypothetical protein